MNIQTKGLNVKITEGMQTAITCKLEGLHKFLKDCDVSVKITQKKLEVKVVIMVVYNGNLIKITERDEDFYIALEKATNTLKMQLSKLHTKKVKRENDQRESIRHSFVEDDIENMVDMDDSKIVKRKQFQLIPMSEEEAINEMETLNHNTFVFMNADLGNKVSLLYKRNDGNYGILESV